LAVAGDLYCVIVVLLRRPALARATTNNTTNTRGRGKGIDNGDTLAYDRGMTKMLSPIGLNALMERTSSFTEDLVRRCPQPSRQEMHKIMSIQAFCLNEYGLSLLAMSREAQEKHKRPLLDAGLRLVSESRKTFAELLRDPRFDAAGSLDYPLPDGDTETE